MRPLLICDCDEVLLHMVRHFGAWLDEAHAIDFDYGTRDYARAMRRRETGAYVDLREELETFLSGFFPAEMERQTLVPHAREALEELSRVADVVILTNIGDHCRDHRIAQLARYGIEQPVQCNQGGKGEAVSRLIADRGAPVAVFVDDLANQHESVARHAPGVHRLQLIAEPVMAPAVPAASDAHARIDDWRDAVQWIGARLEGGVGAS